MAEDQAFKAALAKIAEKQSEGQIAELSINRARKTIQVRPVGPTAWLDRLIAQAPGTIIPRPGNEQNYYFLTQPVRPGSGIIRAFGGKYQGPAGTLTCFLSTRDGRDHYFVGAGHVLSNFWTAEDVAEASPDASPTASIYRYQKGFPATKSTRFLGKLVHLSPRPRAIEPKREPARPRPEAVQPILKPGEPYVEADDDADDDEKDQVDLDVGVVKVLGNVKPTQRTTCYGTFGEWLPEPGEKVEIGQVVMKCGAEEPHWTYAVVTNTGTPVTVYGPGRDESARRHGQGQLYELSGQVILSLSHNVQLPDSTDPPRERTCRPSQSFRLPFAVPGDSGTMVVDAESKRPVGMLIAGSVLDGRYVMTPIHALWEFWTDEGLVLARA